MRLKDLKQTVHVLGRLVRFLLEIDLVTARPERRRRRMLQGLDGRGRFQPKINHLLVKDSQNAIQAAVSGFDATMLQGFLHYARNGGVDDGSRAAGLGDERVSNDSGTIFRV